jgi:Tfp pilus assembly protein PilO
VNRRGPLIAAVASGVVVLLALLLVVLPKIHEVGKAHDDLLTAQSEDFSLQAQLKALRDAQAAAPAAQKQIKKIEKQIPTTADLPGLFRLLRDAADLSAVDFFSFSPGTPVTDASAAFSTLASSITVTGSYFSLEEFLHRLEILPRAAKVTSISLTALGTETSGGAVTGQLQMQVQAVFFTTDTSAGPGSLPGPTQGTAPVVLPVASPPPTESPSPESLSPTESPSPTVGG